MLTFSFCLMVIRPWQKLPIGSHGHMICMGNLGGVFSQENTPDVRTETYKSSFFPYKQISGRNGDHERLWMTNSFILCDLLWKGQKCHTANRECSFKWYIEISWVEDSVKLPDFNEDLSCDTVLTDAYKKIQQTTNILDINLRNVYLHLVLRCPNILTVCGHLQNWRVQTCQNS